MKAGTFRLRFSRSWQACDNPMLRHEFETSSRIGSLKILTLRCGSVFTTALANCAKALDVHMIEKFLGSLLSRLLCLLRFP